MMKNNTMIVRFGLVLCAIATVFANPMVNTTFGSVKGVWLKTRKGLEIAGFLGLPYAEAPIGNLRFENPRSWTRNWTGVFNATHNGSECVQIGEKGVTGNEDCLYLNVFTPTISTGKNNVTRNKNLTVLVFVHGGAFNVDSSNSNLFAPTYLLDYNVVLVTMNYRLNALGFFSTGNDVASGNFGLKDVLVSLQWVNRNIQNFGGNPRSVTLIGASAGASIAHILASSKKTEGLFHKLITMSGSAGAHWSMHNREDIRNESLRVARLLGCVNETNNYLNVKEKNNFTTVVKNTSTSNEFSKKEIDKKMLECLKGKKAQDIVNNSIHAVWQKNPMLIFGPTLEAENEGAILTVHPVQSLKDGLFRDMPWMTGVTEEEGLLKSANLLLNGQLKAELINYYEKLLVSDVLEMKKVLNNVTTVTKLINDFYFNNNLLINFDYNITQLIGDALITWPIHDFLQKQVIKMKSNVYFYMFSYTGTFSTTFKWNFPYKWGAAHYDDVNYLFPFLNTRHANLHMNNSKTDIEMINEMCELWTNFAKTGVPSALRTITWEPYNKNHRFIKLGNGKSTNNSMQENFLPKRMVFWTQLMNNYSIPIKEYKIDNGNGKTNSSAPNSSAKKVFCISITIFGLWISLMF